MVGLAWTITILLLLYGYAVLSQMRHFGEALNQATGSIDGNWASYAVAVLGLSLPSLSLLLSILLTRFLGRQGQRKNQETLNSA